MADAIDFAPLERQTDYVGDYANAFATGRALAASKISDNAMTAYGQDPTAPIDPRLAAANPAQFGALQDRQQQAVNQQSSVQEAQSEAGGDLQGAMTAAASRGATGDVMQLKARIDAAPAEQRAAVIAQAQQGNEILAHALIGLKGATNPDGSPMTPPQRLAAAQHMIQTSGLSSIVDPSTLTVDDVTDQGISSHLAAAMTTEQFLKNEQAQAELGEKTNHDRATEANAAGELSVSRGRLGVEQAHLALDRQKAGGGGAALPVTAPGAANAQPQATIGQIPQTDQAIVQALIDGRYPIPSGAALRNPQMVRYLQEAAMVDPTFDAANAATRVSTRKDFMSGKSAQTITALNMALGHANEVAGDVKTLNNSNIPILGPVINATRNALTDPTTGNTTAFNTHASALATEAAKVFQGGVPHEAEVKHFLGIVANPNASQVQQRAAIQSITELLGSRLDAMKSQYVQGMGKSSTPLEVLHPDAAAAYARLSHLRSSVGGGGGATAGGAAGERTYNPKTGRLE